MSAKKPAKPKAPKPEPVAPVVEDLPDTVMVKVGGNGLAGRVRLGEITYDQFTPRRMARADFERLQARYDLREVKEQ